MENYINVNKNAWNKRVMPHVASDFYKHEDFLNGKSSLNKIELDLLGDVSGKKILHLQCHFGQDSISLSRMGAHVTGVDFSELAIEQARKDTERLQLNTKFICCDVNELDQHLEETFDIIFTSYGVLGWLPDLNHWANLIHRFLKPSGKLILVEFHPVVWMFDDNFTKVTYRYFKDEPIITEETGTYADVDAPIENKMVSWNHGLSEVYQSLKNNNVIIKDFREYDYSPYPCFSKSVAITDDQYGIEGMNRNLPLVYSIVAEKGN